MNLAEKIMEAKNEVLDAWEKKHPYFVKFIAKVIDNKRFGMQILDKKGKVLEEYTLITEGYNITKYEKGLKNTFMTTGIKKSFLEETLKLKDDFLKHPIKAYAKILPKCSIHLIKGDVKFGKTKKKA